MKSVIAWLNERENVSLIVRNSCTHFDLVVTAVDFIHVLVVIGEVERDD
jgi:hypothetical protein